MINNEQLIILEVLSLWLKNSHNLSKPIYFLFWSPPTRCWYLQISFCRQDGEHGKLCKTTICIPFKSFQHCTDFPVNCLYLTPCYALFSHHPRQTPSLCPFITNVVTRQIQLRQSKVRFEAFGQGLRVQLLNWSNSRSSQSSLLGNLSGCWTVGFCMKYGFFYLLTFVTSSLQIWSKTALKRHLDLPNKHPNTPQPIWPPQNNQWRIRITTHLHMSLKYARWIDLRAHIHNFLSHCAAALI